MTVENLTSTSSWVCPANVNLVLAECVGGGAGAGWDGGGGGGGGAYAAKSIAVTPGNSYTVTIGSGGGGGSGGDGTDGGETWFVSDATVKAVGGSKGLASGGGGGNGGSAGSCIGDTTRSGGAGAAGGAGGGGGGGAAGTAAGGGSGSGVTGGSGSSPGGNGGGGSFGGTGSSGSAYGGGGGGGALLSDGGAGFPGLVRLTYTAVTAAEYPIQQVNYQRNRNAPPRGRAQLSDIAPIDVQSGLAIEVPLKDCPDRGKPLPTKGRADFSQDTQQLVPYPGNLFGMDTLSTFTPRPAPAPGRADLVLPWFEIVPWPLLFGVDAPSTVPPARPPAVGRALGVLSDPASGISILPPGGVLDQQDVAPRRLPLTRSRTQALDGHQVTLQDVSEHYAAWALPGLPPPARPPRRGRATVTLGDREGTLGELVVGWDVASVRPQRQPARGRVAVAEPGGGLDPSQADGPFWFAQQTPPVALRRYVTQRIDVQNPPWFAFAGIVVSGPFWCAAGQVSPAAGAVAGQP